MSEFAAGGIIKSNDELPTVVSTGCDYIIPTALAKKWREELDRLNEDMLD